MTNARKGLERQGCRTYLVRGAKRVVAIDREYNRKFAVRDATFPRNSFFAQMFRRLRDARSYAEEFAGIDTWPDPAMPKFLRRAHFEVRA